MKILHLPDSFFPWRTGGKEVFVLNLIQALSKHNVENSIAVHSDGSSEMTPGEYLYKNIRVVVLGKLEKNYINNWNSQVFEAPGFKEFLEAEKPDLVHFHDQSGGASLSHLRIVKKANIKTVLTYHSPGQSCPQRALLIKGKSLCDGKLIVSRCSDCLLTSRGVPTPLRKLIGLISYKSSNYDKNKFGRILGIKDHVQTFINSFNEIYTLHDKIQVHAQWSKEVLMLNGVPEEKIFFSKQGIPKRETNDQRSTTKDEPEHIYSHTNHQSSVISHQSSVISHQSFVVGRSSLVAKLKLLFIGRCEWVKGVHILIDAVKLLPKDTPVEVHFLGPYWDTTKYGKKQLNKINGDSRFMQPKILPPEEVYSYMQKMDVCVIPSLWPETGPLVMLEAFQSDLPVIGSNIGGMAENIQNGVNGLLFTRGDTMELAKIIEQVIQQPHLFSQIKNTIITRLSESFASDIYSLYKSIVLNESR